MGGAVEEEVWEILEKVSPQLKGRSPGVQGAVLADLLAMWLAGHWVERSKEETHALREKVLRMHVEKVWELVEENAKILGTEGE